MTPPSTNTNPPLSALSLAASDTVPSNVFISTANIRSISPPTTARLPHGQNVESPITMKMSETSAISLRSAFNAAAPANRLPTELVVKILTSGAWSDWWELVALTHTCRHWRNIALGTPQLWADAVHCVFAGEDGCTSFDYCEFLPTLLERSEPWPLRADFEDISCLTQSIEDADDDDLNLLSHISRMTHLSVENLNVPDFRDFVDVVGPYMQNLESLHMPLVKSYSYCYYDFIDIKKLWFWHDTAFPRLHTHNISAHCFLRPIAVASLRDVVLWDGVRSYDSFLDALDRCAHGLQSLMLNDWLEPWGGSTTSTRTVPVWLANLRQFRVFLHDRASAYLVKELITFLFASLSFPPDLAIYLDWKCNPRIIRELLPKDFVGLHAPSFFDSMCLHLYMLPNTVTLYCYVNDTEHLTVRENPLVGSLCSESGWGNGWCFNEFLDEHRYTTVTQLAIDFDMKLRDRDEPFASADLLQKYVGVHPLLRRLDLFGKAIGNIQLSVAETFLSLPSPDGTQGAPGKTLEYVCKVAEHVKSANKAAHLDNVCAELDNLEQVLKSHEAAGGARLQKLELCVVYCVRDSHDPSQQTYPYVHRFPPARELTACVASTYLQRFGALADEVVFVGHVERRNSGPGYRLLTDKGPQLVPAGPGSKRSTGGEDGTISTPRSPSESAPPRKRRKN